ncbi:MAG: Fic family protein [Actinomycetia bacterium]|nr:Fic family protein [Actinomycetes bacterium]
MKPEEFTKSKAGQLRKGGNGRADYWTFIPNPLPPVLQYSPRLVSAISEATFALGQLSGLGRQIPNPRLFALPFMRKEAVLSSKIEGTQTEEADVIEYEGGQLGLPIEPRKADDLREVVNYIGALEYGLDRLKDLPVSLRLLTEIHAQLLAGVRGGSHHPGEFRTSQNWIDGRDASAARYVPPPVPEMSAALSDLEKYIHSDDGTSPLIRLGLIHYQFEAIHPFEDGNGRIGRLLISLLVCHWGLLPLPLLYLSAYFERNRDEYLDRMFEVSRAGDWESWLVFFLNGVATQSRDAAKRAADLEDLHDQLHNRLHEARASANALHLLDQLFAVPVITINRAQEFLGSITYMGAQGVVEKLVEVGILRMRQEGRLKTYYADDILRVLR